MRGGLIYKAAVQSRPLALPLRLALNSHMRPGLLSSISRGRLQTRLQRVQLGGGENRLEPTTQLDERLLSRPSLRSSRSGLATGLSQANVGQFDCAYAKLEEWPSLYLQRRTRVSQVLFASRAEGPTDFYAEEHPNSRVQGGQFFLERSDRIATHRVRINTLALSTRLPTISGVREYVETGGLMSYGPNFPDLFRRAGRLCRQDSARARSRPTCLSSSRPSLTSSSTSRPRRRSASACRRRYSLSPTR